MKKRFQKLLSIALALCMSISAVPEFAGCNLFVQARAASPSTVLSGITGDQLQITNGKITFPAVANGMEVFVRGSELAQVVNNNGEIGGWNIGNREVTLLIQARETANPSNKAEKNVTVTIPDHKDAYQTSQDWFPDVTNPNPCCGQAFL